MIEVQSSAHSRRRLRRTSILLATCLALIPAIALSHGRGSGWHGGSASHGYGGFGHGSYRGGYGYNGGGFHVSAPVYRPDFRAPAYFPRFYARSYYRGPGGVIRFGTPGWRSGSWYYGWRAGQAGWWWGINDVWYSYPTPVYPYPVAAPVVAEPIQEPPVNYYCQSAGKYYPQLAQCPEEWLVLPANPSVLDR